MSLYVDKKIIEYIVRLVTATRPEQKFGSIPEWVQFGASPRASLAFVKVAQAYALLQGRDFVIPEDIQYVAYPVLNHRIILSPEREMEGYSTKEVVNDIVRKIEVPR